VFFLGTTKAKVFKVVIAQFWFELLIMSQPSFGKAQVDESFFPIFVFRTIPFNRQIVGIPIIWLSSK
jgi:hypothetical protein